MAAARVGERYSGERYSGLIGDKILKYRAPIGILLMAITAYFGYGISKLTIGTSFVDSSHAIILTFSSIIPTAAMARRKR